MEGILFSSAQGDRISETLRDFGARTPRLRYALTWAVCCGLLLWRAAGRFSDLHLWAEDGAVYLSDGVTVGLRSLLEPYAGYYHVLPRGLTWLVAQHGLAVLPQVIFFSSLAVYGATAALIVQASYRRLVRSDALRVATACALCLAPGFWETLGALTNLQWTFLLAGGLIACKDLADDLTTVDALMLFFIGSCTGAACTLLLPFVVRAVRRTTRAKRLANLGDWACVAVLLGWACANLALHHADELGPQVALAALPRFGAFTAVGRYVLQPLLGEMLAQRALDAARLLPVGAVLGFAILRKSWPRLRENPVFGAWILSSFCIYLIAFVSRPQFHQQLATLSGIDRFAVPAGQCALLLWVVCLAAGWDAKSERYGTMAAFAFLCLYAVTAMPRFEIGPYSGASAAWAQTAQTLTRSIEANEPVTLPCRPNMHIAFEGRRQRKGGAPAVD